VNLLVINVARADVRRNAMAAALRAIGQPFEILEATDGSCLNAEHRAQADPWRRRWITPYPLTDNEIACYISHLRAMRHLLADAADQMLAVLEDDVLISPDLPAVLQAIETCGKSFDFIDLHRNFKHNEIFVQCHGLLPGYALGRVGYTHMRTLGYVVSRQGAETFLTRTRRLVHAVDKSLHRYWANGLDIYGLERPVIVPDEVIPSSIDETRERRTAFADARALHWQVARRLTRAADSIAKRLYFPLYVYRGRRTSRSRRVNA
jgi:glycosyl transferase family 25